MSSPEEMVRQILNINLREATKKVCETTPLLHPKGKKFVSNPIYFLFADLDCLTEYHHKLKI